MAESLEKLAFLHLYILNDMVRKGQLNGEETNASGPFISECPRSSSKLMQGMGGVVAFATEQDEEARREAAAANETWLAYPDDDPLRTVTSGADSRAALTPLLAHQVNLGECTMRM